MSVKALLENHPPQRLTLALTILAATALELALTEPGRSPLVGLLTLGLCYAAPTIAAARWLRRRAEAGSLADRAPRGEAVLPARQRTFALRSAIGLVAVAALPFLGAAASLAWSGRCPMLEVVLLHSTRNLSLGLSALAYRSGDSRLAAVLSLLLILVAASLAEGPLILGLIALYAVVGMLWLITVYWSRLHPAGAESAPRGLFLVSGCFMLAVVATMAAALPAARARASLVLGSLLPTSGGTDWNDPDSRGGVNDGDNEVNASENPQSIGFTDSDVYLDTDRPSLYDAFNEFYGEPFKPKRMDRMIALGNERVMEQSQRPSENLRAGREFALTRRKNSSPKGRPANRDAQALLYVKGKTPLHIRLAAYGGFDGRVWSEEPFDELPSALAMEKGTTWFRWTRPFPTIACGTARHAVKIGRFDSSTIAVPPHVSKFRLGCVNRADFFEVSRDGALRMAGRTVPAGTVVETEAYVVDPLRLAGLTLAGISYPGFERFACFTGDDPYRVDPAVGRLAISWAAGHPRGWGQIEAVINALRAHNTHDRRATVQDPGPDIVGHFLLHSQRGPDYLFASAAVVLLRSLGYPSRLVSGFYAAPERFDPRTRHTSVRRDDVHVWAEVLLPGGTWVALEPTPGYRLMEPDRPWFERLAAALTCMGRWARRQAWALGAAALVAAVVVRFRRELRDGFETLRWRIDASRAWPVCVLTTLRLVEARSRGAGLGRPRGTTPARWFGSIALAAPGELRTDLKELVRIADWIVYAPSGADSQTPWPEASIRATCRRVARAWTLGRFRALSGFPLRKVIAS